MNKQRIAFLVIPVSLAVVSTLSTGLINVRASSEINTDPGEVDSIYLPLVLTPCSPDTPGESDNVNDALIVCNGQTVSGQVSFDLGDDDDVFKIQAEANQQITLSMNGSGGDADLLLYPPGTTDVWTDPWVYVSANDDNNEFIQYTVQTGGYWYIDVYSYEGTTNYYVTITLTSP